MQTEFTAIALIAALAVPAIATAETTAGRQLAETLFDGIDSNSRGYLDQGQFRSFGKDVFVSMDGDDDRKLTLKEFMSWDYGMRQVAQENDREKAYETALRVIFSFWDRDGDGMIAAVEHNRSVGNDFRRADLDEDALMTKDEFLNGFSVMVALRAAINPAPVE